MAARWSCLGEAHRRATCPRVLMTLLFAVICSMVATQSVLLRLRSNVPGRILENDGEYPSHPWNARVTEVAVLAKQSVPLHYEPEYRGGAVEHHGAEDQHHGDEDQHHGDEGKHHEDGQDDVANWYALVRREGLRYHWHRHSVEAIPWERMSEIEKELLGSPEQNARIVDAAVGEGFGVVLMVYGKPHDGWYRDKFMYQAVQVLRRLKTFYPAVPVEMFVSPDMIDFRRYQLARECVGGQITVRPLDIHMHPNITGHMYKVVAVLQSTFAYPLFLDTDVLPCPHSLRVLSEEQMKHSYDLVGTWESGRGKFHATAGQNDRPRLDVNEEQWETFLETGEINTGVMLYNMESASTRRLLNEWIAEFDRWRTIYFPESIARGEKIRQDTDQGPLRVAIARERPNLLIGLGSDVTVQKSVFQKKDKGGCGPKELFRHGSSYKHGDRQGKVYPPMPPPVQLTWSESLCDSQMFAAVGTHTDVVQIPHRDRAEPAERRGMAQLHEDWWKYQLGRTCPVPDARRNDSVVVNLSFPLLFWDVRVDLDQFWSEDLPKHNWSFARGHSSKPPGNTEFEAVEHHLCKLLNRELQRLGPRIGFSFFPWPLLLSHIYNSLPNAKFIYYSMSDEQFWYSFHTFHSLRTPFKWGSFVLGECADPSVGMHCREQVLRQYRAHKEVIHSLLAGSPRYLEVDASSFMHEEPESVKLKVLEQLRTLFTPWHTRTSFEEE